MATVRLLLTVFFAAATGVTALAQNHALAPSARADAERRLPRLIWRARTFPSVGDRARLVFQLAKSANWHDHDLAKCLLVEAFDIAGDVGADRPASWTSPMNRAELRAEILGWGIDLDPLFAREILDRVAAEPEGGFGRARFFDWNVRGRLLARVGAELVGRTTDPRVHRASDPETALRLGRESLQYGVSIYLDSLIGQLKMSAPAAGVAFEDEVLAAVEATDDPNRDLGPLDITYLGTRFDGPSVSPALSERYLEAIRVALERTLTESKADDAAYICFAGMANRMDSFERYDPNHVPDARALLEQAELRVDPVDRARALFYSGLGSAERLEADAKASESPSARRDLGEIAGWLYLRQGREEDALRIAGTLDEALRDEIVSGVWRRRVDAATSENRLDEAVRMAANVSARNSRIAALMAIAERVTPRDRRHLGVYVLEMIRAEVSAVADVTFDDALVAARVATIMYDYDRRAAFDVAEWAVSVANACSEVPTVAPPSSSVVCEQPVTRDVLLRVRGGLALGELAKSDYFRALRIARSYRDPAFSLAAQLDVVEGVLAK